MNEQEILHYRLTNAELLLLIGEYNLKYSELKVYLHFLTLDPFGDRSLDFVPAEVCLQLKIKKSAFHGSIARLKTLGLLNIHIPRAKARVTPISKVLLRNSTTVELNSNVVESGSNVVELNSNQMESHSTKMNANSNQTDKRSSKPFRSKGSKASQTNQTNQTNPNSFSQQSATSKSNPIERENLSLFEEWKKTAAPGEPEDFEGFVRKERIKLNKEEILHFPSFMGDKYFPEWLKKWQAKKAKSSGKLKATEHYEDWTEARHKEVAKEYAKDPITWQSQETWRVKWIEFVANTYPTLFVEVLRETSCNEKSETLENSNNSTLEENSQESEPPSSAVPPATNNSSKSKQTKQTKPNQSKKSNKPIKSNKSNGSDVPNNARPSQPPTKSKFSLKRKLSDMTPSPMARETREARDG